MSNKLQMKERETKAVSRSLRTTLIIEKQNTSISLGRNYDNNVQLEEIIFILNF